MPRRGGGSRGGGRSRGGSRRSSRSSFRRHGYYGLRRGYYGRRYYRGYGRYRSRQLSPIGGAITIMIFLGIFVVGISAVLSTPQTERYDLDPGTTRELKANIFLRTGISVSQIDGVPSLKLYEFSSEPPLSETKENSFSYDNEVIEGSGYISFSSFMNTGSTVDISWNSTFPLNVYVIVGDNKFSSWKNGEDAYDSRGYGQNDNLFFTTQETSTVHIAFENTAMNLATASITLDYTYTVHDVSGAENTYDSMSNFPLAGKVVIAKNTGSGIIQILVVKHPRFGFGTIAFVLMLPVFLLAAVAYGSTKKEKERLIAKERGMAVSTVSGMVKRPKPSYCTTCGSGLMPDSVFCTSCGTKV